MPDYEAGFLNMVEPVYIPFNETGGEFAFGCVTGAIYDSSDSDAVEFIWGGDVEMNPASGNGWAELQDKGSLEGEIRFNNGDDVTFVARPWDTSSTAC